MGERPWDGYYNVSIMVDILVGFIFEGKSIFSNLPMNYLLPQTMLNFMKFPMWAIKADRPDLPILWLMHH